MQKLLSRNEFREQVFKRDNHHCIFCSDTKISAHHIIDRALFSDGGYYIDNGASVCDKHHWDCEKTDISVEDVRKACKIKNIILPQGYDINKKYDKWGNPLLKNGMRDIGVIFFEENVQKILQDKMWLFEN